MSTKSRYMERMVREAIEIKLRPNNMNREDGLCLSRSWIPLIRPLKGRKNSRQRDVCRLPFSGHEPPPLILSALPHPPVTSWHYPIDPPAALKRTGFFPLSLSLHAYGNCEYYLVRNFTVCMVPVVYKNG
jgi:hypothetical protein